MIPHAPHDETHPTPINPSDVDWSRVRESEYLVHQRFQYEYPARILDLQHQLMVIPPTVFGDQRRTVYSLRVSEAGEVTTTQDLLANTVIDVRIPSVESGIEFEAWVSLRRAGPPQPREVPVEWLTDVRFLQPTVRTQPDAAIEEAAAMLAAEGLVGLELAERINAWVHQTMKYVPDVTGIRTTAAHAFAAGHGVCQDYSHLMIAICRLLGLPALYVSGHLLGEGGTHSWVEVILPSPGDEDAAHAWALDPTHGRRVDLTYLTVAVGREYGDVAPTSGSYRAGHGGTLTGFKEVRLVGIEYD